MLQFVENRLNLVGSADEVRRFIQATREPLGAFKFNALYAMPKTVEESLGGLHKATPAKAREDWRGRNWGCLSDTIDPMDWEISPDGTQATTTYATALCPPDRFLVRASKDFGIEFTGLYLCESGLYVGWCTYRDGKRVSGKHYDWMRDCPPERRAKHQLGFREYWPFEPLDWCPEFLKPKAQS